MAVLPPAGPVPPFVTLSFDDRKELPIDGVVSSIIQAIITGAMTSVGWAIISPGDYADSRGVPGINRAEALPGFQMLVRPNRLVFLDGRNYLLGHQVDAAHGDLVGHRPLPAPQNDVAGIDQVDDLLQLLDDCVGVAGDDLNGILGIVVGQAGSAGGDVGGRAPGRFPG